MWPTMDLFLSINQDGVQPVNGDIAKVEPNMGWQPMCKHVLHVETINEIMISSKLINDNQFCRKNIKSCRVKTVLSATGIQGRSVSGAATEAASSNKKQTGMWLIMDNNGS